MSHYPNILPAMVRPRNLQVGAYYAIALFMTKTEGWPEPIQHLGIGGGAIFGDLSWSWYLLYMILSVLQRVKMKVMHVISYHMIHRSSMHTLKFRWECDQGILPPVGCRVLRLPLRDAFCTSWSGVPEMVKNRWEPFNWRLPVDDHEIIIRNCQRQGGVIICYV